MPIPPRIPIKGVEDNAGGMLLVAQSTFWSTKPLQSGITFESRLTQSPSNGRSEKALSQEIAEEEGGVKVEKINELLRQMLDGVKEEDRQWGNYHIPDWEHIDISDVNLFTPITLPKELEGYVRQFDGIEEGTVELLEKTYLIVHAIITLLG